MEGRRLEIKILYSRGADYHAKLKRLRKFSGEISKKWGVKVRFIETSRLSRDRLEGFKTVIRSIPPQVRGKIVSSRNYRLPLSNGRNLNVTNTPIALVYNSRRDPLDVYPHLTGTFYMDVEGFMARLLEEGPSGYFVIRGLIEDPLKKILADAPHILEEGLAYMGCEVKTPAGTIDLILKDKDGKLLIVEVETKASDSAVSQVCRLASGYSKVSGKPLNSMRKAVVCVDHEDSLLNTCMGGEVELYRVRCERLA
ncbi:MAG: endonuclease NucS domain-containing protein [Candidatus Bathyarchaeia archaeon]